MSNSSEVPFSPHPRIPFGRRILEFLFGYDYFISYAWSDGRAYAVALADALRKQGFECFLDSSEYATGENWRIAGRRAIRKTARLLLVVTPGALNSEAVLREVEAFGATGRTIIPVNIGTTLPLPQKRSPILEYINDDILRLDEPVGALAEGPSESVIARLRDGFRLMRQTQKRMRALASTAGMFAAVATVAAISTIISEDRRKQSVSQALAAQSRLETERQPDLALLLAAEAYAIRATGAAVDSLAHALAATPVKFYVHHENAVTQAIPIPHQDDWIAWCDWEGNVNLIDLANRRLVAEARTSERLQTLAVNPGGDVIVAGGANGVLHRFRINDKLTRLPPIPIDASGPIRALHWLDDRRILVSTHMRLLLVVDSESGRVEPVDSPHTSAPEFIAFDAGTGTLMTAGLDKQIVFWDRKFNSPVALESSASIVSGAVRPGGQHFALGLHDHGVEIWKSSDRKPLVNFSPGAVEGRVLGVGFSHEGNWFLWGGDSGKLGVVSFTENVFAHYSIHTDAVLGVTPLPENGRMLSWGRDGKVAVLDLVAVSPLARRMTSFPNSSGWITAICHIPELDWILLGDQRGNLLNIDLATGAIFSLPVGEERIADLHWDSRRKILYIAEGSKHIRSLAHSDSGWKQASEPILTESPPVKFINTPSFLAYLTETGRLVAVGEGDSRFDDWPLPNADRLKHNSPIVAVAHPKIPALAYVNGGSELWWSNRKTGRTKRLATTENFVRGAAFSHNGKRLYCQQAARIDCFKFPGGELDFYIQTGVSPIADFALLEEQNMLACMNYDNQLTFWSLNDGGQIGPAINVPQTDLAAMLPIGDRRLLTLHRTYSVEEGIDHYTLYEWTVDPRQWLKIAKSTANRKMTIMEKNRFGLR